MYNTHLYILTILPSPFPRTYLQKLVHQNTMRSTGGFSFASNRTMGSENPTVLVEMWEPRRCDDDVLLSQFFIAEKGCEVAYLKDLFFFLEQAMIYFCCGISQVIHSFLFFNQNGFHFTSPDFELKGVEH